LHCFSLFFSNHFSIFAEWLNSLINSCDVERNKSLVCVVSLHTNCLLKNLNSSFRLFTVCWCSLKLFSSLIPFLIPKDSTILFLSISVMLASKILAKLGMQSYSISVFVPGVKYSETGLTLVCRDIILARFEQMRRF